MVHLLQSISFFPFYLRVMRAENTILQLYSTYWIYILPLYIEYTEPPLNIIEVHPIYRSVMFCIWIFGVKVCLLCRFFVSFYVYIKSRLFGELNGSYFRNKAQYLVSIFIFCSDLFTLQLIVIDLILIAHHRVTQFKNYLILIFRITDDIFNNSFLNGSIFVIVF